MGDSLFVRLGNLICEITAPGDSRQYSTTLYSTGFSYLQYFGLFFNKRYLVMVQQHSLSNSVGIPGGIFLTVMCHVQF